MNAKQHLEKLSGYGKQLQAMEQDSRYSSAYRETLKQAVHGEMKQQIAALPGDLKAEYKAARVQYEKADKVFTQAVAALQEGWDYARLNYVMESVRATVNAAREVYDAQQAYKAAQGDKYQARAWHDAGAQAAAARFGEVEAGQLLSQINRDREAAANTPEVVKAREAGAAVINSIVGLKNDTKSIVDFLDENKYSSAAWKIHDISEVIQVKAHWEGEGIRYSVEFPDESPAAGNPAPAAAAETSGAAAASATA